MKRRATKTPKKITTNMAGPYSYSFSGPIATAAGRTSLWAKPAICSSYHGKWLISVETTSKLYCAIRWMQNMHKNVLKDFFH